MIVFLITVPFWEAVLFIVALIAGIFLVLHHFLDLLWSTCHIPVLHGIFYFPYWFIPALVPTNWGSPGQTASLRFLWRSTKLSYQFISKSCNRDLNHYSLFDSPEVLTGLNEGVLILVPDTQEWRSRAGFCRQEIQSGSYITGIGSILPYSRRQDPDRPRHSG